MKRFPYLLALLLSAALVALPACDSGDDDDDGGEGGGGGGGGEEVIGGVSAATFTGDVTGSFDGNAYFALVENDNFPDGRGFVLIFADGPVSNIGEVSESFQLIRFGGQPEAGAYPIDTDPENGGVTARYFAFSGQSVDLSLNGETGTLTLTESSAERVAGTFEFSGTGFDPSNQSEILDFAVTGSFSSILVEQGDVDPNFGGF